MQTAIINSESKSDLKLLLELAKKIGLKSKVLSASEMEEMGLINAIKTGRTGEYVNTSSYIKKLKK
jgi:predicted transcriptional regulator